MESCVICPTFSSSIMRLSRSSIFREWSRSGPLRLARWKNSSLSTRAFGVWAWSTIKGWIAKHSDRLTADRASRSFRIVKLSLGRRFQERGYFNQLGRLFNGHQTKRAQLETVSTTCDSGWVRERWRTHPLSQVVLTVSKLEKLETDG